MNTMVIAQVDPYFDLLDNLTTEVRQYLGERAYYYDVEGIAQELSHQGYEYLEDVPQDGLDDTVDVYAYLVGA